MPCALPPRATRVRTKRGGSRNRRAREETDHALGYVPNVQTLDAGSFTVKSRQPWTLSPTLCRMVTPHAVARADSASGVVAHHADRCWSRRQLCALDASGITVATPAVGTSKGM